MNLTALRDRCEERFRDPTNSIVTEAQWLSYLNEAYRDVINASPFWPFKESISSGSLTVSADAAYVTMPTDATRVLAVFNATDELPLTQLDGRTAHNETFPDTAERGVPTFYRVFAGRIYVFPIPSADTALTVEYPGPPTDLAAGSDEPVFPEPFHAGLIEGALARAHADDGDFDRAAGHQAAFEATLGRMLTDLLAPARASQYPSIVDDWDL